jgi:branched-chain amino acid transport system ATP-binding protein
LLLDEPSEGLAPRIIETIAETVRELSRGRGLSVLLVEQNADLVRHAADRCEVIEKGSVVAQLRPEELGQLEVARTFLAV